MAVEVKKNLNDVTGSEISEIFEKLKNDGAIFRYDFIQIAKHLLKEFLHVQVFTADLNTLTAAYVAHIELDKEDENETGFIKDLRNQQKEEVSAVIKDEKTFAKYICKTYFDLIKEPKEELLNAYVRATQDIKEIDETLSEIKEQQDEIYKRNLAEEIQEKKPILYYYQEHNERAKAEILNFIKGDIRDYALGNCYDNTLISSWLMRSPYSYSWNPKSYKPRYPNDLENKFGDLPYSDFLDLSKQYKEDKPAFYKFLTDYITQNDIIFSVGDLIHYHHILDDKKEIISEALNTFQHGAKIMFANAVPTIIEGVLHDLCLLIGEKQNDLLQGGFQDKLNKLQNVLGLELHYEYYSFRFRLFRNKVAHGRLRQADVDELADLLLLDLYHICKLVQSDKLELNHKRFVINELYKNISQPDFKFLLEYLLLDKIEVPPFYKLETQLAEIEKLIVGNEFWAFLEAEMDKGGEPVKHGIYLVLKVLSSRKPFDKRCTKLFKKSGIDKVDKEIADGYLKYLTRDFFVGGFKF